MNPDGPSHHQRKLAALGLLAKMSQGTFRLTGRGEGLLVRADLDRAAFDALLPKSPTGRHFQSYPKRAQDSLYNQYVKPAVKHARAAGHNKPFLVWTGDNRRSFDAPTFVRSRTVGHPGLGVLLRYPLPHHAPQFRHLTEDDRPFAEKDDRAVWRGATTGRFHSGPGEQIFGVRYHVAAFQRRNTDESIDVGYSNIVQQRLMTKKTLQAVKAAVRPSIPVEEMLTARYILCLEGNDIASGLVWALHSNSCVLMPTPRSEGWLCEGMLKPFVHYVPVSQNLSNLTRMVAWCRRNEAECANIAAAGRAYIASFYDDAAEDALEAEVANTYFRRVKLVPAEGGDLPAELF